MLKPRPKPPRCGPTLGEDCYWPLLHLPRRSLCVQLSALCEVCVSTAELKRIQHVHARHARRSASSGRPTPTASGSLARRRCYRREDPDGRRTVAGYKRRPCTDGCRQRTVQFQQSSGRGSAQRRQGERESSGSQSVDQGEHPVPNVEEEQAAAATLRRWHGQ